MSVAKWIEANAGTGKTSRLTDEIVERFRRGVPFDRLCAVTFTEKAANEMVERLRARVVGLVQAHEAPPYALDRLNESFVGTIHAFCSRILRRYGHLLGLPPLFAVDPDGSVFQSLMDTRWDRFVGRHLNTRGEHEAFVRTFGLHALRQMVEKLAQRRHTFRPVESDDLDWLVRDLQDMDAWNLASKGWVPLVLQALADYPGSRDVLEVVLEAGTLQEHTAWKNAVQDLIRCRHFQFHSCLSWLKRTFVNGLLDEYRALGYLRFDDMILDTRELLKYDLEVRREVKARYDLVLVDEMQDTDPVQYEIFLYLCERNGQERDFTLREVMDGSKRLALQEDKFFGVGDPKQSIYGFRSADIGAYEAVKDLLSREGVIVEPLATNYRSCGNLIRFTNRLAKRLFPAHPPVDSHPGKDYCSGRSMRDCIRLVEVRSLNAAEQHLRILSEANWLANRVSMLISGAARKPQHIGILLRKLTSAHLYVDALNAKNIRVVIEGERFFYQSQEVIDFLNLLKWVVDDMDDLALAGVLRSPLFGLTDPETAMFFRAYGAETGVVRVLESVLRSDAARLKTLCAFLDVIEELRSGMSGWTPGGLLREVFARLPVLIVAGLAYGNSRKELAPLNLLKIHKLALAADADPAMSAYRFVRTLESFSKESRQTGQEPMADEALPAVRIMSIHQSKGLDFPVVFVPLTDYGIGAFEDAAIVKYDWKTDIAGMRIGRFTEANYLRLKYGGDEDSVPAAHEDELLSQIDDEERRVLYVAATRAKEELLFSYVPWVGKKDPTGGRPVLELLSELLAGHVPDDERVMVEASEPWLESAAAEPDALLVPIAPILEDWKKVELAAERRSRLQHGSVTGEARPEEEEIAREEISHGPAVHARLIGLICHGVMQRVDFARKEHFAELVAVEANALKGTFNRADIEAAASECLEILDAFFRSEASVWLAAVEILGREVPVLLPELEDRKILSGKIDLLARENQTLFVIDYKTNVSLSDADLETYRRQMALYVRAVTPAASGLLIRPRLCLLRRGVFIDL